MLTASEISASNRESGASETERSGTVRCFFSKGHGGQHALVGSGQGRQELTEPHSNLLSQKTSR